MLQITGRRDFFVFECRFARFHEKTCLNLGLNTQNVGHILHRVFVVARHWPWCLGVIMWVLTVQRVGSLLEQRRSEPRATIRPLFHIGTGRASY